MENILMNTDLSFEHVGHEHLIDDTHVERKLNFDQERFNRDMDDYVEDMSEWLNKSWIYKIFKFYLKPICPDMKNYYIY